MPPASPVPGWWSGEVCTESIATRRGLRCSRSRGDAAVERRPSLAMYWLTWRSSSLRAWLSEGVRALWGLNTGRTRSHFRTASPVRVFTESLPLVAQPFENGVRGARAGTPRAGAPLPSSV
ncbi:hypothetical protein GCM10017779_13430 [Streptomyces capillispiralis]|nr:hypothetical protein GCM10017779_13430 [Streptomyces capillispiralis]